MGTSNANDIRIKPRTIGAIETYPDDYDLLKNSNYSYIFVGYKEGNNHTQNYKLPLSRIIQQISKNVSGKSAYELAVEYGFTGTEEEWVNLSFVRHIAYSLTNVTANSSNVAEFKGSNPVTLYFTPNNGYSMPDSVSVDGAQFTYNKQNKSVTISKFSKETITITISAGDKVTCTFNNTTLDGGKLYVEVEGENSFNVGDIFTVWIDVRNSNYTFPSDISCTGCQKISYDNQTGCITLKCTGTHNQMSINATAKDNRPYVFGYAIESNTNIFTVSNGEITEVNWDNLKALSYSVKTTGTCGFNFAQGITWNSAADVEGQNVWIILPQKYYNSSQNLFIDDSNNKYYPIDVFGNRIELLQPIKTVTDSNNITYILYNISNNGVTGTLQFRRS